VPSRPAETGTRRGGIAPGQAVVEFALVLPLFVMCTVVVIVTTLFGLRSLALAGLARDAARVASVADDPCAAASALVGSRARLECRVAPWDDSGAQSVRIELEDGIPGFGQRSDGSGSRGAPVVIDRIGDLVSPLLPRATAVMLLEPPPVLG